MLYNDLKAILNNDKCTENISIPSEFIKELKKVGGSVELFFWDCSKNVTIDI